MPYLDKEEKFYDYRTAEIEGEDIFDINKASNSDAQQILNGSQYWKETRNTASKIVEMTPYEYFERCAHDCFNESTEKLIQSRARDTYTIDHLKQVIQKYNRKFPIPYIDYARFGNAEQEGLHRMYVAGELFGWDKKFPVQVIDWVDKDRAAEEHERRKVREIERYVKRAVDDSLMYKYYNLDEFKDQLQSDLEREFRYVDGFEDKEFNIELNQLDSDQYQVIIDGKYKALFWADELKLIEPIIGTDDLEDIDAEELSDWLKDILNN